MTTGTPVPERRPLFDPDARTRSPRHTRIWAAWEILYTVVDFTAAGTFVVGSVMFLSEDWTRAGTWLFIFGSLCFALKPTIRLVREVQLWRLGDVDDLAKKLE